LSFAHAVKLLAISKGLIYTTTEVMLSEESMARTYNVQMPSSKKAFQFQLTQELQPPKTVYSPPEKILVISDIEGDFSYIRDILQCQGVINKQCSWTYGKGHLVIIGDVFDRGNDVTECLWFIN